MAEKKTTTKKQTTPKTQAPKTKAVKKPAPVKVEKEVVTKEVTKDYSELLNKILVCLYVLIAILVINTMVLFVKGGSTTSSNGNNQGEEQLGEYDVSMFKTITADTLKDEVSSDTAKIVYIGRSSCGYCVQFLPVLQQAQEDYGYETLYLDITTVTSEEQQNKILAFDNEEKFLEENFGGTPMVLLMKDGKIVDTWIGYAEYSQYASWLEDNGFAKK